MKYLFFSLFTLFFSVESFAQDAAAVDKALTKAVRSTRGTDVAMYAMPSSRSTTKLTNAVSSAVNKVLKDGAKANFWTTRGLKPEQISEIAASGRPFTTLLTMKGDDTRQQLETMVEEELENTGAISQLESASETTGFEGPDGGKNKEQFIQAVSTNILSVLDENGSRVLDSI